MIEATKRFKLNKLHKEIIEHRLSVPDAMAEYLEVTEEALELPIKRIRAYADRGYILDTKYLNMMELRILDDIATSQAFINCVMNDVEAGVISSQKHSAYQQAQDDFLKYRLPD